MTATLSSRGHQTTCDVTGALHLANTGVPPLGQANGQILGGTAQNCVTDVPNCVLAASYTGMPWSITTNGDDVAVSGISYNTAYSGIGCALNGIVLASAGSVTGEMSGNVVGFDSATGINTSLGQLVLDGTVELYADEESHDSRPVELT